METCWTGIRLQRARTVVKVDSHDWADWSGQPGLHVCAAANALPFRQGAFDLVASFDVLEHLEDDRSGLGEQVRVTRLAGTVVFTVPADPRLWSHHDDAVGHKRRYRRAGRRNLTTVAGLDAIRVTHFFSFLWLPALLTRRSRLRTSKPGNARSPMQRSTRGAIALIAWAERTLLRRVNLPFGTSILFEGRRATPP